jgi:membrane associated rhomboid family serine protease
LKTACQGPGRNRITYGQGSKILKVTYVLVGTNVVVFSLPLDPSFHISLLLNLNAPGLPGIITSMFLHANTLHLIVNMMALVWIGRSIDKRLSPFHYVAAYLTFGILAGITASMAHQHLVGMRTRYMLGASGAIAGLGGMAMVLCPTTIRLYGPDSPLPFISAENLSSESRRSISNFEWEASFVIALLGMVLVDVLWVSQMTTSIYNTDPIARPGGGSLVNRGAYAHLGGWAAGILWASWLRFSPKGRKEYRMAVARRKFLDGDWWEAAEKFERLEQSYSADPEIALWMARCFEMTGDTQRCYEFYDKAIHLYAAGGEIEAAKQVKEERSRVVSIVPQLPPH